jgi:hypothetical protein
MKNYTHTCRGATSGFVSRRLQVLCSHNFSFADELTSASVFCRVLPFMVALTWIAGFGVDLVDLVPVVFVAAMSLV